MKTESFDDLLDLVLADRVARVARNENAARRKLAREFDAARNQKNLSVRELAKEMETSISQVQRLLHIESGSSLTMRTIFRAADVLDLSFIMHVLPSWTGDAKVVPISTAAWKTVSTCKEVEAVVPASECRQAAMSSSDWDSTDTTNGQPICCQRVG
jgi:transcriptional regulator with XRE-family HTH domain